MPQDVYMMVMVRYDHAPSSPTELPAEVIQMYPSIDPAYFVPMWNDGYQAIQDWEVFCQSLCDALFASGFLTATGLDLDGYSIGSLFRLIIDNRDRIEGMVKEGSTNQILIHALIESLNVAYKAKSMKQSREIKADWARIHALVEPIMPVIHRRMESKPERALALGEVFTQAEAIFDKAALKP